MAYYIMILDPNRWSIYNDWSWLHELILIEEIINFYPTFKLWFSFLNYQNAFNFDTKSLAMKTYSFFSISIIYLFKVHNIYMFVINLKICKT